MSKEIRGIWVVLSCLVIWVLIVTAFYVIVFSCNPPNNPSNYPKIVELSIEHLWEEDNKYYFADTNGVVYQLGNNQGYHEKILYDDMHKQRFEELNASNRYEVVFIEGLNNWISISEKEMVR